MAAPWGDSRYPPFPAPYPPAGPPVRQRQPHHPGRPYGVPQAAPGFYNPAIFPNQPGYGPPVPAATGPPVSQIPNILKPGRGPSLPPSHRSYSNELQSDLFFGAPAFPQPHIPGRAPPPEPLPHTVHGQHPPTHPYPHHGAPPPMRHSISAPVPPIPAKPDFSVPPLPPKPPFSTLPHPGHLHASADGRSALAGPVPGPSQERTPRLPPKILTTSEPAGVAARDEPRYEFSDDKKTSHEDEELERALRMSAMDAEVAKKREDEELARALQASMHVSSPAQYSPPTPLARLSGDRFGASRPAANGYADHRLSPPLSSLSLYPEALQMPDFPLPASAPAMQTEFPVISDAARLTSSPPTRTDQIRADEEFARRLAEEERLAARQNDQPATPTQPEVQPSSHSLPHHHSTQPSPPHYPASHLPPQPQATEPTPHHAHQPPTQPVQAGPSGTGDSRTEPGLPRYDDVIHPPSGPSLSLPIPTAQSAPASTQTSPHLGSLPPPMAMSIDQLRQPSSVRSRPGSPSGPVPMPSLGRSSSAQVLPTMQRPEPDVRTGRSQSFTAYGASNARHGTDRFEGSNDGVHGQSPRINQLPVVVETPPEPSSSSSSSPQPPPQPGPPGSTQPSPSPPLRSAQFIDDELLRGVSIGFGPPVMTAVLAPMQGPIPNVVGLPYGRAPPLHFKSPNWHDMLKLMARMSGTRLEATVEAMAVVKTAMQLRVVVNFVRVHQSSNDWHVILYVTLDMPVPDNHRERSRYRNSSDPGLLPYSYTLSPTPAFLRENADGMMSKWYTIPASSSNPYPTLPIMFPDLATYLMSALEYSRHAAHDRSSGLNRLAKWVDTLYPSARVGSEEDEESRSGGLSERFGRLFGRSKTSKHDNDERSNLVTPFFADEYGS